MPTTHKIRPIIPAYFKQGDTYVTPQLAAAQDFLKGCCIVRTASADTVEEAGTDPTVILGFSTAGSADYAWKNDTFGFVNPAIPISIARDRVFRGSLARSASTTLVTIADVSAEVNVQYGLVKDTISGYWVVDHSDTSNKRVEIVRIDDEAMDGDSNIPVLFVVLAANQEEI